MSTKKILSLLKKYWIAFLLGSIFEIVGISMITGILIYVHHFEHVKSSYLIIIVGVVIGLLHCLEGFQLFKIPFKNK